MVRTTSVVRFITHTGPQSLHGLMVWTGCCGRAHRMMSYVCRHPCATMLTASGFLCRGA